MIYLAPSQPPQSDRLPNDPNASPFVARAPCGKAKTGTAYPPFLKASSGNATSSSVGVGVETASSALRHPVRAQRPSPALYEHGSSIAATSFSASSAILHCFIARFQIRDSARSHAGLPTCQVHHLAVATGRLLEIDDNPEEITVPAAAPEAACAKIHHLRLNAPSSPNGFGHPAAARVCTPRFSSLSPPAWHPRTAAAAFRPCRHSRRGCVRAPE
ncbi:hypothetical protein B0H11DRAFT_2226256 [Mycena galericulata]|nr:hypothetical protein B0H11DRAFT_2226256 [Mycena galericulata]